MQQSTINTAIELPTMEHFYTLQGEGKHAGRAAYFIRLAGCDVGCSWCDVKESWDADKHPILSINELVQAVVDSKCQFCVITGGEPTLYDIQHLIKALQAEQIEVAMETSGTNDLTYPLDWYCFSPKKFKAPVEQAYQMANELKIVINHPSDFEWAEMHASKVNADCVLFLQTEWDRKERFLPMIIDYIKDNPKWKLSLQTHKYLDIP